ncbi:LPXTG cell wall anchor domain-containing protein, partial [Loigolactobacillus coryniformis]|uniref:LPXTG cell wall anchor domain-containing protein n=1 Tax=Loigolactobacillus coryniformis TaxID=1610 RepID=UPI00201AA492
DIPTPEPTNSPTPQPTNTPLPTPTVTPSSEPQITKTGEASDFLPMIGGLLAVSGLFTSYFVKTRPHNTHQKKYTKKPK